MSCRRQAKTHICHCETDAPTPPPHFSLPHSHSSSHSLIHYTLLSLMGFFFSYQDPYLPKPDSRSLQITLNSTNTCFPGGSSHTHTLSCFDCWIMHYDYFHMKHLKKKKWGGTAERLLLIKTYRSVCVHLHSEGLKERKNNKGKAHTAFLFVLHTFQVSSGVLLVTTSSKGTKAGNHAF